MRSLILKKSTWLPYLMLSPVLFILGAFFIGGILLAFLQSLGYFPIIGLEKFTLIYYKEVITSPDFMAALGHSFYICVVSTLISTVIGVYLAYYIAGLSHKNKGIDFLYKIPIAVPHIVAALMIVFMVSQGGIIARLVMKMGFISEPNQFPSLIYSKNAIGIILIYIWKEVPFITLMVYTVMANIQKNLGEVALTLGASKRQVFYHVILPLSTPAIMSASVIVFAYSFGAFEIPYLLGATYPRTLPVWAYLNYISPDLTNRPIAMVISMIITVLAIIMVWLYTASLKKLVRYKL